MLLQVCFSSILYANAGYVPACTTVGWYGSLFCSRYKVVSFLFILLLSCIDMSKFPQTPGRSLVIFMMSQSDILYAVTAVDLKQIVRVDKDLQICAYYAGHVRFMNF